MLCGHLYGRLVGREYDASGSWPFKFGLGIIVYIKYYLSGMSTHWTFIRGKLCASSRVERLRRLQGHTPSSRKSCPGSPSMPYGAHSRATQTSFPNALSNPKYCPFYVGYWGSLKGLTLCRAHAWTPPIEEGIPAWPERLRLKQQVSRSRSISSSHFHSRCTLGSDSQC